MRSGGSLPPGCSLFPFSRETGENAIGFNVVNLSAKKFLGPMVVLNYFHVSNIFK